MLYPKTKFYTLGDTGSTPPAAPATDPITTPATPPVQTDAEKNHANLRKDLEKANKEIANFKKVQSDAENAKLIENGELQKVIDNLTKERDEANNKYSTTTKQSQVQAELLAAGLSPKQVDLLTPSLMSQVKFGDDNQATNLVEVINNTKTDFPQLFVAPPAVPAGTTTGVTATTSPSTGMTPEKARELMQSKDAKVIFDNQQQIETALNIKI